MPRPITVPGTVVLSVRHTHIMVVRDTVASIVTIGDAGTTDTFRSNEKGRSVACGLFS
jgi:hypothetical protein